MADEHSNGPPVERTDRSTMTPQSNTQRREVRLPRWIHGNVRVGGGRPAQAAATPESRPASTPAQAAPAPRVTLRLTRDADDADATMTRGTLEVLEDGQAVATYETLEPPGPDSAVAGSGQRIPAGTYRVQRCTADTCNTDPDNRLDVTGAALGTRAHIRFHVGNTTADTEGCILPGETETPTGIGRSRAAMAGLRDRVSEGADVELQIINGGP